MRRLFFFAIVFGAAMAPAFAQSTVLDRSLARNGANVLQIEAGGAAIVFVPSADVADIRVRVDQDTKLPVPMLDATRSGNRMEISIKPPVAPPVLPFLPSNAPTYTITYPAGMRLDARLSSGDVTLTRPTASVELYDQDGNITVNAPHATITAENGRGDINVTGALGPIDLEADAGDVKAALASGWSGNEVRIQTASGAIHLIVPDGFRAKIDASSDSGTVHSALSSNANAPFVWLYAVKGDVFLDQP